MPHSIIYSVPVSFLGFFSTRQITSTQNQNVKERKAEKKETPRRVKTHKAVDYIIKYYYYYIFTFTYVRISLCESVRALVCVVCVCGVRTYVWDLCVSDGVTSKKKWEKTERHTSPSHHRQQRRRWRRRRVPQNSGVPRRIHARTSGTGNRACF